LFDEKNGLTNETGDINGGALGKLLQTYIMLIPLTGASCEN
jgi:hypothetical protein